MEKKPTKFELPPRALLALLLGIFIGAVFHPLSGRYGTSILGAIVAVVGVVVFLRWYKWW